MSVTGTLASLFGGLFMGLVLAVSLLIQVPACRSQFYDVILALSMWGAIAGGLGSLVRNMPTASLQVLGADEAFTSLTR